MLGSYSHSLSSMVDGGKGMKLLTPLEWCGRPCSLFILDHVFVGPFQNTCPLS